MTLTLTERLQQWGQLTLLVLSTVLLLTGCGGGGGSTTGSNVTLLFTDPYGGPIAAGASFSATISGGSAGAGLVLTPNANGLVTVNLEPGTYTVVASYTAPGETTPVHITTTLTVAGAITDPVAVALTETNLDSGWALFRAGDYNGAKSSFQTSLAAAPGSPSAISAIAWTDGRLGDFAISVAGFNTVTAAHADNVDAFVGAGGILLARNAIGDPALAKTALAAAINLPGSYQSAPTHDAIKEPDLWVCLALANYLQGDLASTTTDLNTIKAQINAEPTLSSAGLFYTLELMLSGS
ncbi:MAG: hypothetical protein ABI743_07925 [bacterium]